MDFMRPDYRVTKNGRIEIYPRFIINCHSKDLMIRGGDFYAVWIEDLGLWSTDEQDCLKLIDNELDRYAKENKFETKPTVLYMWDAANGMIDVWLKYCQRQSRDNYHTLDEKLIFADDKPRKEDYASKRLPYRLEPGEHPAFDKIIGTLYSDAERDKLEWAIGAIVSGDSKDIQKFIVLYGEPGTGKSTIIEIIQQLFTGYYSVFDAKALGNASKDFALESLKTNPLVAIQHDADLSRIDDNTKLNSLISHEVMVVNEKHKSLYNARFNSFLFIGTNKPVKITDSRSGIIRRLIDVTPTGNRLSLKDYMAATKQIKFELGAIAYYCKERYLSDPLRFNEYVPTRMLDASNDFYNFIGEYFYEFVKPEGISLKRAWEMYGEFCEDTNIQFKMPQRTFKEELKAYFDEYEDRHVMDDGTRIRSWFKGFKKDKFTGKSDTVKTNEERISFTSSINLNSTTSLLDDILANCPAQYAGKDEAPTKSWDKVETSLKQIDTRQLHYVMVPENHIVIDFDIPDVNGNKSLEKNLEEASKWPQTYTELSKSGKGVHLHYIYKGDVTKLSRVYDEHIEIKVFTGKSSLRRKVSLCNDIPVKEIKSGLPLKEDYKMVNFDSIKNEKALRTLIIRNLNKEYMGATKPSVDFIYKCLEDAYNNGLKYDVTDLRNDILVFASNSSHQANYCISKVNDMKFCSDEPSDNIESSEEIIFYDVEVFPNLFLVNWKFIGKDKPVNRMINPKASEIEPLLRYRLVGFNCRRYDNHILYACYIGYSNAELYNLSKRIISGGSNCFFGEAYNLSYTDIYDYASTKQSLKKWEIELGIHHQELGMPWDQPVPEDKWELVAEYCDNDVIATEAVWEATQADFTARQMLADIAGMTVNDTTNSLTTRIIFGKEKKPQSEFNYRNMADLSDVAEDISEFEKFDSKGRPLFPGYKFDSGKSIYRGEEVGEGGYVYAEPGIYHNVALLDIASMHPSSTIDEELFGKYTKNFKDIRDARIFIKHKDFDSARKMLGGKLAKYLTDEESAGRLAKVLKIPINSVYGLTAAGFDNPFRDVRNKDNIVAKRGALFMINLKHRVQEMGYTVAHIKTDSIKIPDADQKIIDFVMEYGRKYGYEFEHEDTYERMCLVNNAVYIAKDAEGWTATGAEFQVPYVFKTLFSKEPIIFRDLCETKAVTSALYLDMNEYNPEEHNYVFIGKVGLFTPIKPGCGGGLLVRESAGKDGNIAYNAVTGSKGYRWLESESIRGTDKERDVDMSYYNKMVSDALDHIAEFGDVEAFLA